MTREPEIAELLPHRGAMQLLSRVLTHDARGTTCEVEPARAQLFRRDDGGLPCWVAIEWMAQCAGVHGALAARAQGERIEIGFLVGSRRCRFAAPRVPDVASLVVSAAPERSAGGLRTFSCRVTTTSGELVAEGSVGVFIPPDAIVPVGAR
ncbi:MAG TPA: hypothetical protein VMW35_20325 [Myxococcota bacterium]|jgi:predicted hotdog family 3-hydroxylacyl-ACP dehydratase|nr:hypothetical protein [Myxococcota bacterium]